MCLICRICVLIDINTQLILLSAMNGNGSEHTIDINSNFFMCQTLFSTVEKHVGLKRGIESLISSPTICTMIVLCNIVYYCLRTIYYILFMKKIIFSARLKLQDGRIYHHEIIVLDISF